MLRWATPDDNTIRYIKVSYYDYLLEQDVVRLASVYADSVLIPDTRKKFGEYEFKVQSYSETGDAGNVQTIKAVSEPAPVQVVFGESKQIALTVDQLSTNAQEKRKVLSQTLLTEIPLLTSIRAGVGLFLRLPTGSR